VATTTVPVGKADVVHRKQFLSFFRKQLFCLDFAKVVVPLTPLLVGMQPQGVALRWVPEVHGSASEDHKTSHAPTLTGPSRTVARVRQCVQMNSSIRRCVRTTGRPMKRRRAQQGNGPANWATASAFEALASCIKNITEPDCSGAVCESNSPEPLRLKLIAQDFDNAPGVFDLAAQDSHHDETDFMPMDEDASTDDDKTEFFLEPGDAKADTSRDCMGCMGDPSRDCMDIMGIWIVVRRFFFAASDY